MCVKTWKIFFYSFINIAILFFRVYSFTGFYYCDNCMSNLLCKIPARAIFNRDFRKYDAECRCRKFLQRISLWAIYWHWCMLTFTTFFFIFNLLIFYPQFLNLAYTKIKMMNRLKLNSMSFYRMYFETVTNTFKEMPICGKYFYTSVHKCSIADFEMLADGQLENLLSSAGILDLNISRRVKCAVKYF